MYHVFFIPFVSEACVSEGSISRRHLPQGNAEGNLSTVLFVSVSNYLDLMLIWNSEQGFRFQSTKPMSPLLGSAMTFMHKTQTLSACQKSWSRQAGVSRGEGGHFPNFSYKDSRPCLTVSMLVFFLVTAMVRIHFDGEQHCQITITFTIFLFQRFADIEQ